MKFKLGATEDVFCGELFVGFKDLVGLAEELDVFLPLPVCPDRPLRVLLHVP